MGPADGTEVSNGYLLPLTTEISRRSSAVGKHSMLSLETNLICVCRPVLRQPNAECCSGHLSGARQVSSLQDSACQVLGKCGIIGDFDIESSGIAADMPATFARYGLLCSAMPFGERV